MFIQKIELKKGDFYKSNSFQCPTFTESNKQLKPRVNDSQNYRVVQVVLKPKLNMHTLNRYNNCSAFQGYAQATVFDLGMLALQSQLPAPSKLAPTSWPMSLTLRPSEQNLIITLQTAYELRLACRQIALFQGSSCSNPERLLAIGAPAKQPLKPSILGLVQIQLDLQNISKDNMKAEIFTVAALIITAGRFLAQDTSQDDEFNRWRQQQGRAYSNRAQNSARKNIFTRNLNKIRSHNAKFSKGQVNFTLGMNSFGDLTFQQFSQTMLTRPNRARSLTVTTSCTGTVPSVQIPTAKDWTTLGAVNPVRNQGSCGCCYSFTAVSALEALYFRQNNVLTSFSQQQIVDCANTSYGAYGCNGGYQDRAMMYVKDNGIAFRSQYAYTAVKGTCRYNSTMNRFQNTNCGRVTRYNQQALLNAITVTPTAVAVEVTDQFRFYRSGILNGPCSRTSQSLNHAVLAVGFGTNFFKIRNTWGRGWAESGYIRLQRIGDGWGSSCVLAYPTIPI